MDQLIKSQLLYRTELQGLGVKTRTASRPQTDRAALGGERTDSLAALYHRTQTHQAALSTAIGPRDVKRGILKALQVV